MYRQRSQGYEIKRDRYERRSNRNGNLNLVLFLAGVVAWGVASLQSGPLSYAVAMFFTLAFVISFVHHDRVKRQLQRYTVLYELNQEGLHRLQRHWEALPAPPQDHAPPEPQVTDNAEPSLLAGTADDLDLLGQASLEHLLGTPNTPVGWTTLRHWILHPADPQVVAQRQRAVQELAPQIDLREEVGLRGRLMETTQTDYERFVQWAEARPWLHERPLLIWASRLLPAILLALGVALWQELPVSAVLGALLLANLAVIGLFGRQVTARIDQVAARQEVFRTYADLFGLITRHSFASPELQRLQHTLSAVDRSADQQLQRLARLMPLAEIRRWPFFFLVKMVTLWNFHLLWLLERWQRDAGAEVRAWLQSLGHLEALAALATLHHDHPQWAFPVLSEEQGVRVTATDLAHPLLPPAQAVGNDVTLGPPGTVLLVTGSNMSGKSTLLRAIGVNTILAQMGAPVCAQEMHLPRLVVASSMRVQDSLAQGVSYFMAELRRLKSIVDRVDAEGWAADAPPVLFLLDEILQGTNTAERQIAARRIILHLVRAGAIGAVSTHDLTLADAPAMQAVSHLVHFTETVTPGPSGVGTMTFDYRLRPGIATSTNALKLMELVGLPLGCEPATVHHNSQR